MSKVLCIYENIIATVEATLDFFNLNEVKSKGVEVKAVSISSIGVSEIDWCDVLFMVRPNHGFFSLLAKKAGYAGKFVITSCDDDLLNLPKDMPHMSWRRRGLLKSLNCSDVILTSSKYIAGRYKKYIKSGRCCVADTVIPSDEIKNYNNRKGHKCIKLVYAAGISHTSLFNRYILPVMPELCQRYQGRISFTCMGVKPDLEPFKNKIEVRYIESLPLHEYRKRIEEEGFDIGLAPLNASEFTKAKYYNKYIEYSMMGIIGIYSNTQPYTNIIRDGENGLLADNTYKGWLDAICRLIDDAGLRENCKNNIYNEITTRFSEKGIVGHIFRHIPELVKYENKYKKCGNINFYLFLYKISFLRDWIYKLFFYLIRGNFKAIVMHFEMKITKWKWRKI